MLPSLSRLKTGILPPNTFVYEEEFWQRSEMVFDGRLFGVPGRAPSVDGYGALMYKHELESALADLKQYADKRRGDGFVAGVLADVNATNFRAYTVLGAPTGTLSLLDVTFDLSNYKSSTASSILSIEDPGIITWANVARVARSWFDNLRDP